MTATPLVAISLGWGVQSFTLAAMSALGDLPPVDVAIHADTTHERSATYEFAQRWTPWLEARGVRVVTVQDAQSISELTSYKSDIPAYTLSNGAMKVVPEVAYDDNDEPYETGEMIEVLANVEGKLRRQCTGEWKIYPMRRWLQANRNKRPVEQWLGISMDEWQRAKDSRCQVRDEPLPAARRAHDAQRLSATTWSGTASKCRRNRRACSARSTTSGPGWR